MKMDKQDDNKNGSFAVPDQGKRKYLSGPLKKEEPAPKKEPAPPNEEKESAGRRYLHPRTLQKDKSVILETQLIDVSKVRERRRAAMAEEEDDSIRIKSANSSDQEAQRPTWQEESNETPDDEPDTGSALSRKAVRTLESVPIPHVIPELTEEAIAEIRAAGKTGDYTLLEPIAKGAESILYKAKAGSWIFCVKAIRNRRDGFIGNSKTKHNQEKLQDVSYSTKLRHLRNEYDVARALFNAHEEMPVVKVLYLRRVTRLGLELGYDLLMEYIQGHDLSDRNILKKFGVDDKIRLMYQAIQAVNYMHKRKFIHLDIKPSNFMITRTGKVRLIDFGISVFSGFKGRSITGTTGYLSPEQVAKETLNEATDIFALGVTFSTFFGGKPLQQNQEELLQRSVRRDARFHLESGNVSAIADLPELTDRPQIAEIIRNCSILKRENRIQNCPSLLMQLQQAAKTYGLNLE
jgi:tRNA A-37 threonylcarbamoyl transferase component Bud32